MPDWKRPFAIDRRSIAAFRIALGALLAADVMRRAPLASTLLTDQGLFQSTRAHGPSLLLVHNSFALVTLVIALGAVCALCLIAGVFVRGATFTAWAIILSLHERNPWLQDGGDRVFLLLLFWVLLQPSATQNSWPRRQTTPSCSWRSVRRCSSSFLGRR